MDTIRKLALEICEEIDNKLGLDIALLNVVGLTSISDYLIIASGNSSRHVNSIADGVEEAMGKKGLETKHKEGYGSGAWILLDYMDIVVHIFSKEQRAFYDLERLWCDAENIELSIDTNSNYR